MLRASIGFFGECVRSVYTRNVEDWMNKLVYWNIISTSSNEEHPLTEILPRQHCLMERSSRQDEAVQVVVEVVLRFWARLGRPQQPTRSFLFLGPTRVGKTEITKALTEQLFDDENQLVQIDMSEYMEQYLVSRLIGASPRYVGHEEENFGLALHLFEDASVDVKSPMNLKGTLAILHLETSDVDATFK
eukprot:Gb_20746 [translate_table: standard]